MIALVRKGLFHFSAARAELEEAGSISPVDLAPLSGRAVVFSVCHYPDPAAAAFRWGLGSCYWTPTGNCPAGHGPGSDQPRHWFGTGVLEPSDEEPGWWRVGGGFPRAEHLSGHLVQIAVAVSEPPSPEEADEALRELSSLRDLLSSLTREPAP